MVSQEYKEGYPRLQQACEQSGANLANATARHTVLLQELEDSRTLAKDTQEQLDQSRAQHAQTRYALVHFSMMAERRHLDLLFLSGSERGRPLGDATADTTAGDTHQRGIAHVSTRLANTTR